jgi:hypothetical protein
MTIILITAYNPRPTTYSVNVNTEIAKVTLSLDTQFGIYGATLFSNNKTPLKIESGFLKLKENTVLIIEWISEDIITFTLKNPNKSEALGSLDFGDEDTVFIFNEDNISFQYMSEFRLTHGSIIIPFRGSIRVGKNVGHQGTFNGYGILKSGEISMIGKSLFQDRYFDAGKYQLSLGDEVIINSETESESSGVIYIGKENALLVNYRIVAQKAWIKKAGAVDNDAKFQISTSLLTRFVKDQLFKTLSLTFASLIGIFTLAGFIKKIYSNSLLSLQKKKALK